VVERLGDGRGRRPLGRPGAERAAGCREDEARDLVGPAAGETLQHRAVLGVHGDDLAAALAGGAHHEVARDDQRLLVGQGDALARAQRGEGRFEPGRADDPDDHHAHVAPGRRLDEAAPARAVRQPDVGRTPVARLLVEQRGFGARGQGDHVEPVPVAPQHLERGAPDRAGGPEDRDADRHIAPNAASSTALTGIT
jgi:hypothetical protein